MSFSIDKQTLDELNLLGKFRSNSVFNLFNRMKTTGGERLLNKLFQEPSMDIDEINHRSSIFRFFQEMKLDFPLDRVQVDAMGEYLDAPSTQWAFMSLGQMIVKKFLADFVRDERYRKIIQGLQATMSCLKQCYTLLASPELKDGPFLKETVRIKGILQDSRLEKLGSKSIYENLSIKELAFYDHLLKVDLHSEMDELRSFIYLMDVYIGVGEVARMKGFGYAKVLPKEMHCFSVEGLWHPSIDNAVGNDIALDPDSNVLFLTGANMAGKSTLMKAIGIALYLAHMGFPVPAKQMNCSLRDGLYTSINVADNMNRGYSHFYAEVMRVKQAAVATADGKKLMLIFDELFKGTNVKDAYDGTLAVTQAFAAYRDCLFIVSTHIIEVGDALRVNKQLQFRYLPTIMEGSHPHYTYRLNEGITADRQGMMMIRNEGILQLLSDYEGGI